MVKFSYHFFSVTLIMATLFTTSCTKKQGCTDPDADNYDVTAEVYDGSCNFSGRVVFWYNETAAAGLVIAGITSLTYYLDGVIVGSSAPSVYWTCSPECGQTGSITVNKDLGSVKSRPYTFRVEDQYNIAVWDDIINFEANTCIKFELRWRNKK